MIQSWGPPRRAFTRISCLEASVQAGSVLGRGHLTGPRNPVAWRGERTSCRELIVSTPFATVLVRVLSSTFFGCLHEFLCSLWKGNLVSRSGLGQMAQK